MSPRGKLPRVPLTEAWQRYWADPTAPHPDLIRYARKSPGKAERVESPLSYSGPPSNTSSHRNRGESFYCHHYRAADEHWHSSVEELERCMR